jgi:NAD-dependent dihydropyrimidine dehydrogenase PreA subunit
MCPVKVYAEGHATGARGYIIPVMVYPEKCVDAKRSPGEKRKCELCILACPDQAITWEDE